MSTQIDEQTIDELLSRGVAEFVDPDDSFRKRLRAKIAGEYTGDIIVKLGVDVTSPDIHLGHAVALRRLRQFQDVGCKVVFVVGDFTTTIGDPTGKSKVRPEINRKEIEKNLETYIEQVGKILKTDKPSFSWIRNSDWLMGVTDLHPEPGKTVDMKIKHDGQEFTVSFAASSFVGKAVLFEKTRMQVKDLHLKENIQVITLRSFLEALRGITHSQLINRDMFQRRIEKGEELYMHEMMYPVLQGIDSYALHEIYGSCDLEVGGADQLFNILMGRTVMQRNNQEPQSAMTFEMLEGTDGTEKMSKSLDNYIGISEKPAEMYGKIMSIPDSSISNYFRLATYTPLSELKKIEEDLEKGEKNPRDIKMRLAREIVAIYHGEDAAKDAEESFIHAFKEGGVPGDAPSCMVEKGALLADVVVEQGLVDSKSAFKRLVEQGAVSQVETGEKIDDWSYSVERGAAFRIGKHRFITIEVQ